MIGFAGRYRKRRSVPDIDDGAGINDILIFPDDLLSLDVIDTTLVRSLIDTGFGKASLDIKIGLRDFVSVVCYSEIRR